MLWQLSLYWETFILIYLGIFHPVRITIAFHEFLIIETAIFHFDSSVLGDYETFHLFPAYHGKYKTTILGCMGLCNHNRYNVILCNMCECKPSLTY